MTHALAKVDEPRSLMDLLWRRSAEQPDLPLYTVLADGEVAAGSITVSRLLTEACSLGSHLFAANLSGQCVLLMYPSGIEFITALFGCISAGVIAVPVPVPANREQSIDHIVSIARDCRAQAILSLTSVRQRLGSWWREDGPTALPWLLTDQDALSSAPDWAGFRPGHETIAYLQYTSGSTSRPKGVVVSHGNVLHNSAYIASVQRNNAESIGVCWLPHFHDMGLIEGIMQPFYSGYRTYLMPPAAFVRNPFLWVRAISRHGATNSGGPDFAYRLCAERVAPEQRSELALGCWRFAYCGAEPIHADTVAAFARFYSPCGFSMRAFYPSYGLAVATLLVSSRTRGEG